MVLLDFDDDDLEDVLLSFGSLITLQEKGDDGDDGGSSLMAILRAFLLVFLECFR